MTANDADSVRNGLAGERSPFLRHGATQPVDWQPWGEAAFATARNENKPVLLDVGAVWCHWCHVMDHESYADEGTAALINELFVPVKVDRDERPDVDARYQRAVQLLTGQGGWPLTAFLTPSGDVYYGGTYFPPDERFGRPSFKRVLREVARVWSEEPDRATEAAEGIRTRLEQYARVEAEPGEPTAGLVTETLEELAHTFDFRYGGFGRAPKFPNAGALDLMLDHWLDTGEAWAKRIVVETLAAMARGGIHDQLGGGFHRYATDARWIIPHFEKMAYDNGVLQTTYARAHAATSDESFGDVARGIVDHYADVAPALVAAGGFPASQDADIGPDDDGDYWTWTRDEVERALDDPQLARAATLYFGLDDPGSAMHVDPSRHVLYRATDLNSLAVHIGTDATTAASLMGEARARLKAVRDGRARPYVDETLYTGWVALVAAGHLAAARYVGQPAARDAALRALDRVWDEAFDAQRGLVHRVGDPESGEMLDDQAYVAAALVDAFELTQRPEPLERARELVRIVLDRFRGPRSSGLFDRPTDARSAVASLEQPHLPIADSPMPGGNAMVALTMLRVAALTHDEVLGAEALSVLRAFAGSAPRLATGAATYIKAVAWATLPLTTVVVVDGDPPEASRLFQTALSTYRPRTVLRCVAADAVDPTRLPVELRAMVTADAPRAYVCAGRTCATPVADAGALRELLHTFRG